MSGGAAVTGEGVRIKGAIEGLGIWDGTVRLSNSTIEENKTNFTVEAAGRLHMSGCTIQNATGIGGHTWGGTIENNGWSGIQALMGSRIIVGARNTIRANAQHGIWLKDTSVVGGFPADTTQIRSNTRYGIFCDPPPAVAQIQAHYSGWGFMLNATHVFGNTEGQISCPGIIVP